MSSRQIWDVSATTPSNVSINRSNPDYNLLARESARLSTYHDWSSSFNVDTPSLACEGFFYTGESDRVQCVFCRNHLRNWAVGDTPSSEHKKKFPNCPFVLGMNVNNVNDISDPVVEIDRLNPDYNALVREKVRLSTFHDWSDSANASPVELAKNGFFYTGESDRVQCAFCRNHLRNWAVGDVPAIEHRKKFPHCPFVQGSGVSYLNYDSDPTRANSRSFIEVQSHQGATALQSQSQNVQIEQGASSSSFRHHASASTAEPGRTVGPYPLDRRVIASRMDTPAVQKLIEMGYNRETISAVLQHKISTTGDDFASIKDLMEAILEVEREDKIDGKKYNTEIKEYSTDNKEYITNNKEYTTDNKDYIDSAGPSGICLKSLNGLSLTKDPLVYRVA